MCWGFNNCKKRDEAIRHPRPNTLYKIAGVENNPKFFLTDEYNIGDLVFRLTGRIGAYIKLEENKWKYVLLDAQADGCIVICKEKYYIWDVKKDKAYRVKYIDKRTLRKQFNTIRVIG